MEIKDTKLLGNDDKYYLGYYQSFGTNTRTVCKVLKDEGEDHTRVWYNVFGTIGKYLTEDGQAMLIYTDVNDTFVDYNADPKDKTASDFWDNKNLSFMYIIRTPTLVGVYYGTWISSGKVYLQQEYLTKQEQVLDLYSAKSFKILKGKYGQVSNIQLDKSFLL